MVLVCMAGAGRLYGQPAQSIVINEFMAANDSAVPDPQGQYSDWIELYNPTDADISVTGLFLTDDLADPTRWQIPEAVIPARGFLVIWADNDVDDSGLHANFSIRAAGEELGLYDVNGITLIDHIVFDQQISDRSFGRIPDGDAQWRFMAVPSPGAPNTDAYQGVVAEVKCTPERGFYDQAVTVSLSTPTPGAEIWYTLDTRLPQAMNVRGDSVGQHYTEPIIIEDTTMLRAYAVKPGWKDAAVTSHGYIFLDAVMHQPVRPAGFPSRWGSAHVDYAMDARVVEDPAYQDTFKDDLLSIPSINIVVDNEDFFGSDRGIYAHPLNRGSAWERSCTLEWLDPNQDTQFAVNAGLRIHGGVGRDPAVAKHSLRFLFKSEYGPSTLDYPLFPDSPVEHFESLVLRATWNYSYIGDSTACGGLGTDHTQYMRECFAHDTVRDMGGLTSYVRHVHVYINGLYWGVYILTERPDDGFASQHLGGDKTEYDVLKAYNSFSSSQMDVMAGDLDAWNTLFNHLINQDLSDPGAYQAVAEVVDIPALIDYMLMIFYVGSRDAPTLLCNDYIPRNFYAIRRRAPGHGFTFIPWDVEWSLEDVTENRVRRIGGEQNPGLLFRALGDNERFRQQVADRIHRYFFNDGTLSVTACADRYWQRSLDLYQAIVGESARWGDARRPSRPYTRDAEWIDEWQRLMNEYIPLRSSIVFDQLAAQAWYPALEAPVFYINGIYQHGGTVQSGDSLAMDNPNASGTLYYSLDGSDPRAAADPNELDVVLISEDADKYIWVPLEDIGDAWIQEDFDTGTWQAAAGGVGFDWTGLYDDYIDFDLLNTMWAWNASCYIRIPFNIDNPSALHRLRLDLRYDDGFAAYINGVRVAGGNAADTLAWDSDAEFTHTAGQAFTEYQIEITEALHLTSHGNILAIQGLNSSINSTDFLIDVELVGIEGGSRETTPYFNPLVMDKSVHLKACVIDQDQWSAVNEAVYSVGPVKDNLRISEIMYHPQDPNTEFIELTNIGTEAINLNLARFTAGIDFIFGDVAIEPNACLVVVGDLEGFEAFYDTNDIPIAGQYSGSLDNAGERIALEDALGQTILNFRYNDAWYPATDGDGLSLIVLDPAATDPNQYSDQETWGPSWYLYGSPGFIADPPQ